MTLPALPFSNLPFSQDMLLVLLDDILPAVMILVVFLVIFKKLPSIMEAMYPFTKTKSDYECKCARCQAERARKAGGLRGWCRRNKYRNLFDKEGMK